jgi:hypothetical protein
MCHVLPDWKFIVLVMMKRHDGIEFARPPRRQVPRSQCDASENQNDGDVCDWIERRNAEEKLREQACEVARGDSQQVL